MDVTWNGQRVDGVEVVRLPAGVSLDQAAQTLDRNADGRDTLGVAGRDADYLILGHGLRAPQDGESLAIDGQPVLPAFLEDERSSATEGYVDPRDGEGTKDRRMITTGVVAIAGAVAGGILGRRLLGSTGLKSGAKIGAALGSTLGLPLSGMLYENGIRPLWRRISGHPTRQVAEVNTSVVQNLIASGTNAPGAARRPVATQPQPPATPLRRISREALNPPAPPPQPTYEEPAQSQAPADDWSTYRSPVRRPVRGE